MNILQGTLMANIYAEHKESGLFYYKEYFIPKEERKISN